MTDAKALRDGDLRPMLLGMSLKEIDSLTQRGGFKAFRAKQLFHWLYEKGIASLDEPSNLPKDYRRYLAENFDLGMPEIVHSEGDASGTRRLVFRLRDDRVIEGVLMRDDHSERLSLCVSSQVGCALDCKFCLTGYGGYQRNLTAGEIIGQILAAQRLLGEEERIGNLVFMGMGEPMLNLDNVIPALELIISPQALGFSARRVTVSTAGVVPGIREFGERNPGASLAVSLNATTNATRDRIMPINRKWPLEDLTAALRAFPMPSRRRITFEYVLLKDINDSKSDARRMIKLMHGIKAKVNLICYNACEELPFEPSPKERLAMFRKMLTDAQFTVAVRYSKGRDMRAGCGQLAAHIKQFQPETLHI